MKKSLILLFFTLLFSISANAQNNVEFTKDNMRKDKNLRRTYKKYVKKGDRFYYNHGRGYLVALEYYLMAYNNHPNSALLNYKIADCYIHTLYKYKALPYALKAMDLNPKVTYDLDYLIGQAYHQRAKFDLAIASYENFKTKYNGTKTDSLRMADLRIKECYNGKELTKDNIYRVVNLGPNINSEYAEYVPLIKADRSFMLFTSRRPFRKMDSTVTEKRVRGEILSHFDMDYHEDIFRVDHVNDSTWTIPCRLEYSTPRRVVHDACVSLSMDGQTIFNYRGNNSGDLYYSTLEDGKWSKTKPLKGINSQHREDHIALSHDNKTAYFVSDRPGGYGGKDIWKATKIGEDEWSAPVNLGPIVNTPFDEEGVFLHPDGKSLYFSSRGHNTMGGYDIFETTFENGVWTEPINMGSPTNSPDDDVFFVLTADGKTAYLSSVKEGGFGNHDIYMISSFEKVRHKRSGLVTLISDIKDKETGKLVTAKITITEIESGKVLESTQIDKNNPLNIQLNPGKKGKLYRVVIESEGYLPYIEEFEVVKKVGEEEVTKTILIEKMPVVFTNTEIAPLKIGKLEKVYFAYNEYELDLNAQTILDNTLEVLKNAPNLKIRIKGYTDNIGSDSFNKTLSQKRAHEVEKYLLNNGLDADRIIKVLGMGKSNPLQADGNDNLEGRAKNRRVEFELVNN